MRHPILPTQPPSRPLHLASCTCAQPQRSSQLRKSSSAHLTWEATRLVRPHAALLTSSHPPHLPVAACRTPHSWRVIFPLPVLLHRLPVFPLTLLALTCSACTSVAIRCACTSVVVRNACKQGVDLRDHITAVMPQLGRFGRITSRKSMPLFSSWTPTIVSVFRRQRKSWMYAQGCSHNPHKPAGQFV